MEQGQEMLVGQKLRTAVDVYIRDSEKRYEQAIRITPEHLFEIKSESFAGEMQYIELCKQLNAILNREKKIG